MMNTAKAILKNVRDFSLASMVKAGALPPRGTLTVLTYHRVIPQQHQLFSNIEPGMRVSTDSFEMHLRILKEYFQPIRLDDWVEDRINTISSASRYCAITFDDGWRDNYDHAYEVLLKHNFPATIFVVPDAIEGRFVMWPLRLEKIYNNSQARRIFLRDSKQWLQKIRISAEDINSCIGGEGLAKLTLATKQLEDQEIEERLDVIEATIGAEADCNLNDESFMTWSQIEEMANSNLVDFGSHTMSHKRLDSIESNEELNAQVVESKSVIEQRLGDRFVNIFCYPNGSTSANADELVAKTYSAACLVDVGINRVDSNRMRIKRISMHDDMSNKTHSFLARLARVRI